MSLVAKCINVVSIKMVKESSFLYPTRTILSPADAYQMIKEQLEDLDHDHSSLLVLTLRTSLLIFQL